MADSNNFYFVFKFMKIACIPFHIFGFIGNILIIRIVHKTREMHTTTNYLLANLAASDSFIILMSLFYSAILGFGDPDFVASMNDDKFFHKFNVVVHIPITSPALTLTLLAVERYHAILKPFRSNLRLHEESIKRAIFFIWFLSIAIGFPGFFVGMSKESSCIGSSGVKIYVLIFSTCTAYIPTVVFLFCYGSLMKGLYFSGTICAENTNEDNSEKRKLLVTFILATSGFLIGYGPIAVLHNVHLMMKLNDELSQKLFGIFILLFDIILCLNPVLYAFRSSNFKEGFKRVLFSRCLRSSTQQNENQLA